MDTTAAPSVALIPPRPSRLADQTDLADLEKLFLALA